MKDKQSGTKGTGSSLTSDPNAPRTLTERFGYWLSRILSGDGNPRQESANSDQPVSIPWNWRSCPPQDVGEFLDLYCDELMKLFGDYGTKLYDPIVLLVDYDLNRWRGFLKLVFSDPNKVALSPETFTKTKPIIDGFLYSPPVVSKIPVAVGIYVVEREWVVAQLCHIVDIPLMFHVSVREHREPGHFTVVVLGAKGMRTSVRPLNGNPASVQAGIKAPEQRACTEEEAYELLSPEDKISVADKLPIETLNIWLSRNPQQFLQHAVKRGDDKTAEILRENYHLLTVDYHLALDFIAEQPNSNLWPWLQSELTRRRRVNARHAISAAVSVLARYKCEDSRDAILQAGRGPLCNGVLDGLGRTGNEFALECKKQIETEIDSSWGQDQLGKWTDEDFKNALSRITYRYSQDEDHDRELLIPARAIGKELNRRGGMVEMQRGYYLAGQNVGSRRLEQDWSGIGGWQA